MSAAEREQFLRTFRAIYARLREYHTDLCAHDRNTTIEAVEDMLTMQIGVLEEAQIRYEEEMQPMMTEVEFEEWLDKTFGPATFQMGKAA